MCKKARTTATPTLATFYAVGASLIFGLYIANSVALKLECRDLNTDKSDNAHWECGTWAYWACSGWVPCLIFIFVAFLTTKYICQQSRAFMKVISSSRAWMIAIPLFLFVLLFVIHFAYACYLMYKLFENGACLGRRDLDDDIYEFADCDTVDALAICVVVFGGSVILFACCCTSLCLFGMVNGRIATPVAYDLAHEKESLNQTNKETTLAVEEDDTPTATGGDPGQLRVNVVEHTARNKLGQQTLTEFNRGDRVLVKLSEKNNQGCYGTVLFFGEVPDYPTQYSTTFPYIFGVELDDALGNTNGVVSGKQYFLCSEGFGVFLAPPDVKKANPLEDPMGVTAGVKTQGTGITITRRQNPNHFQKADLTQFLKHIQDTAEAKDRNVCVGRMACHRIASLTPDNLDAVTDEFLDLLPDTILSNKLIVANAEATGLSMAELTKTNPNGMLFNTIPTIGQLDACSDLGPSARDLHGSLLRTEMAIDFWYLELTDEWRENSERMVLKKYVDWSASMEDGFTRKWMFASHHRLQEWLSTLLERPLSELNAPFPQIKRALVPTFVHQATQIKLMDADPDDVAHNKIKKNQHYIPLGFFRETELNQGALRQVVMPCPQPLEEGSVVEFEMNNLVHEPVNHLEELYPYWRYKMYVNDPQNVGHAWFPIDCVYVEVKFDDQRQNLFNHKFQTFQTRGRADSVASDPYADEKGEERDPKSYNPFYLMKNPRIPLCYLSVLLPLAQLEHYFETVDQVKEQKRFGHVPMDDYQQPQQQPQQQQQQQQQYSEEDEEEDMLHGGAGGHGQHHGHHQIAMDDESPVGDEHGAYRYDPDAEVEMEEPRRKRKKERSRSRKKKKRSRQREEEHDDEEEEEEQNYV